MTYGNDKYEVNFCRVTQVSGPDIIWDLGHKSPRVISAQGASSRADSMNQSFYSCKFHNINVGLYVIIRAKPSAPIWKLDFSHLPEKSTAGQVCTKFWKMPPSNFFLKTAYWLFCSIIDYKVNFLEQKA